MKSQFSHRDGHDARQPAVPAASPPLSRPFPVDRVKSNSELEVKVEADAAERAELAKSDGLLGIERLEGHFRLTREGSAGVRVAGEVRASVVQACIVSLDPLPVEVHEIVDLHFVPAAEAAAAQAAMLEFDESVLDAPDPPDPIVDGSIDLGAVTAEFLALGLDPYPRKPGATLDPAAAPASAAEPIESPFAVLRRLGEGKG